MTTITEPGDLKLTLTDVLRGRAREVVLNALVAYLDQCQKIAKKEMSLGLDAVGSGTPGTEQAVRECFKLLRSLGWTPPAKQAKVDDDTGELFDDEPAA